MTKLKKIYCKALLQGKRWRNDVIISLDPDGLITGIEQGSAKDATECIYGTVIPGMPNAHSHAFQRAIAGRTGPRGTSRDSFWSWREAMYRCAGRISPDQFTAVAAGVFVEMLKAGYTTCAEFHYVHHQPDGTAYANLAEMSERLLEAASDSRIAMTLLPVLYCSAGFGLAGVEEQQRRFTNSTDQYLQLLAGCQKAMSGEALFELGIAPHSLRAVPGKALHEVLQAWPEQQYPVHIHIAEQPAEVESSLAHLGARPVEWVLDQFPVDKRWCLVHATHMSDNEVELAAASGATAGLCPTTEADLGDGRFKIARWLRAGGRMAVGSDSNVRISVAEELRLLEYNERLSSGQRNVLTESDTTCGRFLYAHAAIGGGIAIGQPVGQLDTGYRADLLELDDGHELLAGREPDVAMDSWIFAGDRSMIKSVWVAGQCVIRQGVHAREESIRTAFANAIVGLSAV
ncbi:MAG: formimidoylglutamate deiminase [Gammaproteobacteria bacterium]|nr:MAG: formimidoylglutamate deiminase [Gammaproteobacteria bacterium]